jgi:transposase
MSTSNRSLPSLRRRAFELADSGTQRSDICTELGVARSTVWRWLKEYAEQGESVADKPLGRPSRLSPEQVSQVLDKLVLGPDANGYDTPLWTLGRIADLISRTTGVTYNPNYVSELMHGLGWSCQKPERRARERNEEAIAGWVRQTWPEIKKRPSS